MKIAPFNDHSNCKGHANFMLDCTYEKVEEQKLLVTCIDNYLPKDETKLD